MSVQDQIRLVEGIRDEVNAGRWTKCAWGRTSLGTKVDWDSSRAHSRCLQGLIYYVSKVQDTSLPDRQEVEYQFRLAIRRRCPRGPNIETWNDFCAEEWMVAKVIEEVLTHLYAVEVNVHERQLVA